MPDTDTLTWTDEPPEPGVYVLSRPQHYMIVVEVRSLDKMKCRDGWRYYGPIPEPSEPDSE